MPDYIIETALGLTKNFHFIACNKETKNPGTAGEASAPPTSLFLKISK